MTQVVELTEYGRADGLVLSVDTAALLRATGALAVLPSLAGGGRWDLQADSTVGIIATPEAEVRIRPKVDVQRLLFLLVYTADAEAWREVVAELEAAADLFEAAAHAFVHHAERTLALGVIQGYVTREESLVGLRGRVREAAQLRRFGVPLPLEVSYDDFTVDVLENRYLRTAATRLCRTPRVPFPLRVRVRHLLAKLDGVSELRRGWLPEVRFTRLNDRYRAAVRLAQLILQGMSVSVGRGGEQATSFLVDMNQLFERFVTLSLTTALERISGKVVAQHPWSLDERGRIAIRPDITWWHGSRCTAAVDAKYKSLATRGLPNADVYQLLAYCTAYGLGRGHLVYAAGNEQPAAHAVRGSGVELIIHALDLSAAPDDLLAQVETLAGHISGNGPSGELTGRATPPSPSPDP